MSKQNRLLTHEEKLQAISKSLGGKRSDIENCITSAQDTKTANYYDSVVIPQLIEEIAIGAGMCYLEMCEQLSEGCKCYPEFASNECIWWQQLKKKYSGGK